MQTLKLEDVVPLAMPGRRPEPVLQPLLSSTGAAPTVVPFPRWQKACDRVSAALLGGENRVVITGQPGTGKTLLLDQIARVLRAAGWTVIMRLADAAPVPGQPGKVVVMIDEADRLSRESLQHLLATTSVPLVLAGLDVMHSRVTGAIQIALSPLGHEEARNYITDWFKLTGRAPTDLEPAAMRRAIEVSGGIPRLISTLLSAASWLAESSAESVITVSNIDEAAALRACFVASEPIGEAEEKRRTRSATPLLVGIAASMLFLGAGAYIATRYYPAQIEAALGAGRETGSPRTAASATGPTSVAEVANPATVRQVAPPTPRPVGAIAATPVSPPPEAAATPPTTVFITPNLPPLSPPRPMEMAASAATIETPKPARLPGTPPSDPIRIILPPPTAVASAAPLEQPRTLPPETISLLMRRGSDMMAIGDVSAARLLFGRAAEAGDADAMVEMGRTFDPTVLAQASPLLPPDPVEAARWYHRAVNSGNKAADELLHRVETRAAR